MQAIHRAAPYDPLYKYQSLATPELVDRVCKSISGNYLYWADPTKFNDPFDCQPALIFEGSNAELKTIRQRAANVIQRSKSRKERRLSAKASAAIPKVWVVQAMKKANEGYLAQFGVCSLSDCNNSILMWSHYSSNHSGICLGFQPSRQAIDFSGAAKVEYSQTRPVINLIHGIKGQNFFDATFLTKAEQWSYESEWRMIEQNITERRRIYPSSALVQVIFGARIKPDDRTKILSAIEVSGATPKLLKAEIDETRFQINLVKL
jgi:Protein of unknown function (DUF2971)